LPVIIYAVQQDTVRRPKPSRSLNIAAVVGATLALFLALWIVVPAPTALLWIVAVAATEYSLFVGALALLAIISGMAAFRRGPSRAGGFAIVAGLIGLLLAQLPFLEAQIAAQQIGVSLSLSQYLNLAPADRGDPAVTVQTLTYAITNGQTLQLDSYRSTVAPPPTAQPAIVVIHGGSWRGGHRSDFARWDRYLAAHGYTVFDIDYHIAPQPNWQTATADAAASVAYIRAHAAALGVDPARIALLGRSAGGHLALLAAYSKIQPPVQAVISLYGPTDLAWGYAHVAHPDPINGQSALRHFLGGPPNVIPTIYRDASPITYADRKQPPTLLIHGGRDNLVGPQHAVLLADRLKASGNTVQFVPVPYALHGFDYNFDGWGSQIVRPTLLRFLHDHLQ